MKAKRQKILVVDDEKVVGTTIKEELEPEGYQVQTAQRGQEAIRLAKNQPYDLAFVDLWMPEMDGVQTCREIKKYSPKTEVVLISGRPDGFAGREGEFVKAGGLDFFLYKPFEEGELLATVKKALGGQKRNEDLAHDR